MRPRGAGRGATIIRTTYHQIRRLAGAHWTTKHGGDPSDSVIDTFIDTANDDTLALDHAVPQ